MTSSKKASIWIILVVMAMTQLSLPSLATGLKDGFYESTARGFVSDVTLNLVVFEGKILKITAKHNEDAKIGERAIDELISQAVEIQGPEVDSITGATETSHAFIEALKNALSQAGWEEVPLSEVHIIHRTTPSPEPTRPNTDDAVTLPVAEVSAPQISFENTVPGDSDSVILSDDYNEISWQTEGDVQFYRVEIKNDVNTTVKCFSTDDTQYIMPRKIFPDEGDYSLTITAVPKNGMMETDGVSSEVHFIVRAIPELDPSLNTEIVWRFCTLGG